MYSQVTYSGDGSNASFAVPFPYLDKSHVSATVDGASTTFTWLSDSSILLDSTPSDGQTVLLSRNSNRQARLTTFQDGQALTQTDLENDAKQLFYVAQEAFDAVSASDGSGDMIRANNLSDVLSVSAALGNLGAAALAGATFTGSVILSGAPSGANEAATKAYVDDAVADASGAAGVATFNGRDGVVSLSNADVLAAIGYTPMNPAGGSMTGLLVLSGPPVASLGAATKGYVDTAIAGIPPPTGEANTASTLGGSTQVYASKSGVNLRFRGLTAGTGIAITQNANDLVIASTASGAGEVNDGLNINVGGLPLYTSKSGVHLQFKGVAAGAGMTQVANATDVSLSVNQAYPFQWTAAHIFNTTGAISGGALVAANANAPLSVYRTSAAGQVSMPAEGNNAAFIEHSVGNQSFSTAAHHYGLRVILETHQQATSTSVDNDAVAFYTGILNGGGKNCVGYGAFSEAYHSVTDASAYSYGSVVELAKVSSIGTTMAFIAKGVGANYTSGVPFHDNDFGFLATANAPAGTPVGWKAFKTAFGVQFITCDYAFDCGTVVSQIAAFRGPTNVPFRYSGADAATVDVINVSSPAELQFQRSGVSRFAIPMSASPDYIFASQSNSSTAFSATPGGLSPINPTVYIKVKIDGTYYKLALYNN